MIEVRIFATMASKRVMLDQSEIGAMRILGIVALCTKLKVLRFSTQIG